MIDLVEVYVDGGSRGNPGPSACAFVIPKQHVCSSKFLGSKTNNEAEYSALILALTYAKSKGLTKIRIFSDSQLVVKQMNGEFAIREPRIRLQYETAKMFASAFEVFEIILIKRKRNREADALCNRCLNEPRHREIAK